MNHRRRGPSGLAAEQIQLHWRHSLAGAGEPAGSSWPVARHASRARNGPPQASMHGISIFFRGCSSRLQVPCDLLEVVGCCSSCWPTFCRGSPGAPAGKCTTLPVGLLAGAPVGPARAGCQLQCCLPPAVCKWPWSPGACSVMLRRHACCVLHHPPNLLCVLRCSTTGLWGWVGLSSCRPRQSRAPGLIISYWMCLSCGKPLCAWRRSYVAAAGAILCVRKGLGGLWVVILETCDRCLGTESSNVAPMRRSHPWGKP
jgi:hypothetical protein